MRQLELAKLQKALMQFELKEKAFQFEYVLMLRDEKIRKILQWLDFPKVKQNIT